MHVTQTLKSPIFIHIPFFLGEAVLGPACVSVGSAHSQMCYSPSFPPSLPITMDTNTHTGIHDTQALTLQALLVICKDPHWPAGTFLFLLTL